jgi:hypothetical protein
MTPYKNQVVEIKQVNYLELWPVGQNKKDVKMKVTPAMSFRINMTLHIVGVAFVVSGDVYENTWVRW